MTTTTAYPRELGSDDVDAVVDLVNLCEIAENGAPDEELIDWVTSGSASMRMVGVDDDAGLAAYGYIELSGGHTGLEADVRVRPGLSHDLATPILMRLGEIAQDFDAAKPLHLFNNSTAYAHRQWLTSVGGREIRHFWRMAIDLDEQPPAVGQTPEGVQVRGVTEADLPTVYALVDEAFAEHFGHTDNGSYDEWLRMWRERRSFDLSLWWLAMIDDQPAAALLGLTFPGTGHVGTLGTLKHARGRGMGTHLLRTSFAEFHARGFRRVTLGVDSENGTGAVRLYESVGMRAVQDWGLYEVESSIGPSPAGSIRSASKNV